RNGERQETRLSAFDRTPNHERQCDLNQQRDQAFDRSERDRDWRQMQERRAQIYDHVRSRLQMAGVEHDRKYKNLRRRQGANENRFDAAMSDAVSDRGAGIARGPYQEPHSEITADFLKQTRGETSVEREGNVVRVQPRGGHRIGLEQIDVESLFQH